MATNIKTYNIKDINDAAIMLFIATNCSDKEMLTFQQKSCIVIGDTLYLHDPYNLLCDN